MDLHKSKKKQAKSPNTLQIFQNHPHKINSRDPTTNNRSMVEKDNLAQTMNNEATSLKN